MISLCPPDQNASQEYQDPSAQNLNNCRHEGAVHVVVADPGDHNNSIPTTAVATQLASQKFEIK